METKFEDVSRTLWKMMVGTTTKILKDSISLFKRETNKYRWDYMVPSYGKRSTWSVTKAK